MNRFVVLLLCLMLMPLHGPSVVCAQEESADSVEQSNFSSYGSYEEDVDSFVPTRVEKWKVGTFPLAVVFSPLIFPGYYVFTKEPDLKKSMHNYFSWIYYRVPLTIEEIQHENIVVPSVPRDVSVEENVHVKELA